MKTITEFNGFSLSNALKKQQELTAAGKTPEELGAAMGEELKMEGDKLKHLLASLDAVKSKTDGVKRVLVMTLAENEKAPAGALKVEETYYVVEHFPSAQKAKPAHADDRGGRGGKGGKGGKGGRGGRDGGGRGERSFGGGEGRGRGPGAGPGAPGEGGGGRGPRAPRGDRAPAPAAVTRAPGEKPKIVPKGGAAAAPKADTPKAE